MEDGHAVSMVLLGVLRKWSSQEDIDLPNEHHLSQQMQDHLDSNVMPNLAVLISSKEHN
ncbi:Uncharacterized protein AC511_0999 [Pseudomonas coronafaciens pv. oryzae]|nr:Uncharacterized protein AC511_0999 [Pseudomonas coronafaciens pv. oryzae]